MLPAYIKIHDQIKKDIDDAVLGDWGNACPARSSWKLKVSCMSKCQAITLLVDEWEANDR